MCLHLATCWCFDPRLISDAISVLHLEPFGAHMQGAGGRGGGTRFLAVTLYIERFRFKKHGAEHTNPFSRNQFATPQANTRLRNRKQSMTQPIPTSHTPPHHHPFNRTLNGLISNGERSSYSSTVSPSSGTMTSCWRAGRRGARMRSNPIDCTPCFCCPAIGLLPLPCWGLPLPCWGPPPPHWGLSLPYWGLPLRC